MTAVTVGPVVADVEGDGFPVVMIHGLGGTSNMYQPQMAVLSGYRTVRIDLPGSGRSACPAEPLTMEAMVSAVVRVMEAVGAGRAHLVGHSMGTMVCQWIAAQMPERVASMVLFGALAEPQQATRDGLEKRAALARAGGLSDIAEQITGGAISAHTRETAPVTVAFVRESITRQDPESYARTCLALGKARAADPRRISAPTLLITGDDDAVNPPGVARDLADSIKGAKLSGLDRVGHWATVEDVRGSNGKLIEFLRQADR